MQNYSLIMDKYVFLLVKVLVNIYSGNRLTLKISMVLNYTNEIREHMIKAGTFSHKIDLFNSVPNNN